MAAFKPNTEGRAAFIAELGALAEGDEFAEIIRRALAEGPALGPRKPGWTKAVAWFEAKAAEYADRPDMTRWIALEGMTRLNYGNI